MRTRGYARGVERVPEREVQERDQRLMRLPVDRHPFERGAEQHSQCPLESLHGLAHRRHQVSLAPGRVDQGDDRAMSGITPEPLKAAYGQSLDTRPGPVIE